MVSTIFGGLDLKGKIVVSFLAAPASVPGAAGAHFGSPAERWKVYKAAGAVGVMFIPNPHSMDLPWERAIKIRLEPFMVLKGGEDLYSGMQLWVMLNPARFPLLLEGTGHSADELLALLKDGKPLPHFDLPLRLSARVDANSLRHRVRKRGRRAAGLRSQAARRARRADARISIISASPAKERAIACSMARWTTPPESR